MKESIDVGGLVVWTVRDQRADRASVGLHEGELVASGLRLYRRSPDGVAAQLDNIGIGGRIQRIGYDTGALHPDADQVWSFVQRLERDQRRGVVDYGRSAELPLGAHLPDPALGPIWLKGPRYDADGRPDPESVRVSIDPTSRRPTLCPLQLEHELAFVEELRAEYATWRKAMLRVGAHFFGHPHLLRRWAVRRPAIPAEPWRVQNALDLRPRP
jgi:hypothetical protein